ncbi:MAG: zinc ribbon domain-containing protein [Phycisphaerae bacterium]|jgi:hypothetical protein
MAAYRPIDPDHQGPRTFLRVGGPLLLAAGGLFMLIGGIDFFSAFGGFEPPRLFWCFFVGMPLLAIGGTMTRMGYLGRVARYMSEEITPVATDTFNYAAHQTQDGIRRVAAAISDGIQAGSGAPAGTRCRTCGADNDADARFCSQCGRPLVSVRVCPACRHENDSDARFCDNCGQALSA